MGTVLVTGGAGFIGSHLVDALVLRGLSVRVLDSLDPQVHGADRQVPRYFNPAAELIVGDVRDRDLLWRCLDGVDGIFHLAAAVGVGQSMYEIERYVGTNTLATSILLDLLANQKHSVRKLVVASSMSVYGEGLYRCEGCGMVEPPIRSETQLAHGEWELNCPVCGRRLAPIPTSEGKRPDSNSVYAITKKDQEEMCLCVGRAYGIPTVATRFFNVYGPRQALSNPYTGVAAIFCSRAMNGKPPLIYEDGLQTRDLIQVGDVVRGLLLVMDRDEANYHALNVGTGRPLAILDVARIVCERVGPAGLSPEVVGKYRKGDIRHCYGDISSLAALGFSPTVTFEEGVEELAVWVKSQTAEDRMELADEELRKRGLVS